jgi:ribonuclease HII
VRRVGDVGGTTPRCPTGNGCSGNWDFVGGARKIVRGDRTSLSIASASILAKVTRDRIMREIAEDFPGYNFEANKGYPCPIHKAALQAMGPSSIHRRSWVFMDHLMWNGLERHHRPDDQMELPLDL